MQIQFLGAAGTVTGSCYLITDGGEKMLVDMGMFQGHYELESLNWQPLQFEPREISTVFLTHAHLDHCGRLPLLVKNGFRGRIFSTLATQEITKIVLEDAAHIMAGEEDRPILYTEVDVMRLLGLFETVSYNEVLKLPNFEAIFRDAGHILGSASIEIKNLTNNKIYAFSGDLGNSPEELVKPFQYIEKADVVVMESTYGDTTHPAEKIDELFINEINEIERSRGALLVPSFSVERAQALLHKISHYKKEGKIKKDTPVYLDSPMGEKVTEIYKRFPKLYGTELSAHAQTGDPFSFSALRVVKDRKMSFQISTKPGAKIIIAGSGMMTGGRILEHAMRLLPLESTRLLIVGFQAEHTVGRALEEGAEVVHIYGQEIKVRAKVTKIHSMSAHADQPKLLDWLKHINGVAEVFLIHGEDGPRGVLKNEIVKFIPNVVLPKMEECFTI